MANEANVQASLPGKGESLWLGTTPATDYPLLEEDSFFDVVVVGGGIVGLTAALLIKETGATVAVVEACCVAGGVSGHTTAKVTTAHGIVYRQLVQRFGRERARQYAEVNQAAVDFVASFAEKHNIACDLEREPAYTYSVGDTKPETIAAEVEAAMGLGLPVSYRDRLDLPFAVRAAIAYENQIAFHPRKYLLAMAERIEGGGSRIFERSRALGVQEGSPCRVRTERGEIRGDRVIVATHFPILDRGLYFARLSPFRSYLLAVKAEEPLPEGMYYSEDGPVYTFRRHRMHGGPTLFLVGGQNHPVGHETDTAERYRRAEAFARRHFKVESVEFRWSTQDNGSFDRVPFIGPYGGGLSRVYTATGFGGWGLSNGTAAGMILADLIAGRFDIRHSIFDPSRSSSFLTGRFVHRNLHVARTFFKDHLASPVKGDAEDLAAGEAGIRKKDHHEAAAYRDEAGTLHTHSPYCTHMGCKVQWNNAEKSWDCPCHGSRFDAEGRVIHAPATKDLKKG